MTTMKLMRMRMPSGKQRTGALFLLIIWKYTWNKSGVSEKPNSSHKDESCHVTILHKLNWIELQQRAKPEHSHSLANSQTITQHYDDDKNGSGVEWNGMRWFPRINTFRLSLLLSLYVLEKIYEWWYEDGGGGDGGGSKLLRIYFCISRSVYPFHLKFSFPAYLTILSISHNHNNNIPFGYEIITTENTTLTLSPATSLVVVVVVEE